MRLKKISIKGFKSFADQIAVDFNPGVTAIVGPNGCGKSNIVDAFRWVLGEQSAKAMRGDKMHDVLFSGTSHRKALNMAEVTITFDQVEKKLPTEYEEVEITRRLFRNGDSDYLINQKSCRLRDIQSLFWDTGVGKNTFSIFEQGKIDQIIHYSPIERRRIFEEAAGIARFKERKKEALAKLEQSQANLDRLADIHGEVKDQVETLERQAQTAQLFKQKQEEMVHLEKVALVTQWRQADRGYLRDRARADSFQKERDEQVRLAAQRDEELLKKKQEFAQGQEAQQRLKEQALMAQSEQKLRASELKACGERVQELSKREMRLETELARLTEQREKSRAEFGDCHGRHQKTTIERAAAEEVLSTVRTQHETSSEQVHALQGRRQKTQQEQLQSVQRESDLFRQLKEKQIRLESGQKQAVQLKERKIQLEQQLSSLTSTAEAQRALLATTKKLVEEQKHQLDGLEEELKAIRETLQQERLRQDRLSKEVTALEARKEMLVRLKEQMEGFSDGAKRLLKESSNPDSRLYGTVSGLYEKISPQPGYEERVATAMQRYAQTLVAADEEALDAVLAFAREHNIKGFSIACMGGKFPKVKEGSLASKVGPPDLAQRFLSQVYTADDLSEALDRIGEGPCTSVVGPHGILVDDRYVIFHEAAGGDPIFRREAELKVVHQQHMDKKEAAEQSATLMAHLTEKQTQLQTQRNELDKAVRRIEMKLVEENFILQRSLSDLEQANYAFKTIDQEKLILEKDLENLQSQVEQLGQQHSQIKEKAHVLGEMLKAGDEQLQAALGALQGHQRAFMDAERAFQALLQEEHKIAHTLSVFDGKDQEYARSQQRHQEELSGIHEQCVQLSDHQKRLEAAIEAMGQEASSSAFASDESQGIAIQAQKELRQIEAKREEAYKQQRQMEDQLHRLEITIAQHAAMRDAVAQDLQQRFSFTETAFGDPAYDTKVSVEQIQQQVAHLRRELQTTGDVNLAAIGEFEQHKERLAQLDVQMADLLAANKELTQIIAKLDRSSRKQFKEAFETIRTNFQKTFQTLFQGGEADLKLTESSDVLEAGVEIVAKPPGKQMRSISLLSGGEKCLTAMALLFGIYELRPAPFCLLDEIDAPLDDTNIERFTNLVKQHAEQTQFVVITHNKRTMSIADILCGVSMEERGVSKVLILPLTAAEALVP